MLQKFQHLSTLKFSYEDPIVRQRAQSSLLFSALGLILSIVVVLSDWISAAVQQGEPFWELQLAALAIFGILVGVQRLVQTGYERWAGLILVGLLTTAYLIFFLADAGPYNPILIGFIVPVVVAAFTVGIRAMLLTGMLFIAVLSSIIVVQLSTDSLPNLPNDQAFAVDLLQNSLIAILVCLFMIYQYVVSARHYIRQGYQTGLSLHSTRRITNMLRNWQSLDQLAEVIRREFDAYNVRLFVRESAEQPLQLRSIAGRGRRILSSENQEHALEIGRSTIALAMRRKDTVVTTIDAPLDQKEDFRLATQAEVAIPLIFQEHAIGVLVLQSEKSTAFTEAIVDLLKILADHLVEMIQQLQLQSQLARQEGEVSRAHEQIAEYQRELQRLNQELQEQVWSDYLRQQEDGLSLQWQDGSIKPWQYSPLETLTPHPRLETMPDGRQHLAVPILLANQVMGEMIFESPDGVLWDEQTLDLAAQVSARLGLALDNARLFDQIQAAAAREQAVGVITTQLQNAREIELLLNQAAVLFNQALGAEQTHIRLGSIKGSTIEAF